MQTRVAHGLVVVLAVAEERQHRRVEVDCKKYPHHTFIKRVRSVSVYHNVATKYALHVQKKETGPADVTKLRSCCTFFGIH